MIPNAALRVKPRLQGANLHNIFQTLLQLAEMQKTLDSLKEALTSLQKGKAPVETLRTMITSFSCMLL